METLITSPRERGLQALRDGDLDAAVDLLTRAVREDEQDADAQACLGIACSQKGLHGEAARALQTAVRLRPQEARYHYNLGVALEMSGDSAAAVQACRRALQVSPSYEQARSKLQELTARIADEGALRIGATGSAAGTHLAPWLHPAYSESNLGVSAEFLPPVNARPMGAGEALGRRFAAALIDDLVAACLGFILGFSIGFVIAFISALSGGGQVSPSVLPLIQQVCTLAGFLLGMMYPGVMLSACGQTVGKMLLGIRVIGPDGKNPSFWRAVLRDGIGKLASFIVFCLGYLWMLWDSEQQTWHDKIAGTRVVRA